MPFLFYLFVSIMTIRNLMFISFRCCQYGVVWSVIFEIAWKFRNWWIQLFVYCSSIYSMVYYGFLNCTFIVRRHYVIFSKLRINSKIFLTIKLQMSSLILIYRLKSDGTTNGTSLWLFCTTNGIERIVVHCSNILCVKGYWPLNFMMEL